jgi:flagellar motor component MotA
VRFVKVFCFVALGFIAASITSPDGLRAVVDPLNGLVIFVASTVGAVLKYVQWQDVSGEAPSMVTLALAPAIPAVLAAPVEGATE